MQAWSYYKTATIKCTNEKHMKKQLFAHCRKQLWKCFERFKNENICGTLASFLVTRGTFFSVWSGSSKYCNQFILFCNDVAKDRNGHVINDQQLTTFQSSFTQVWWSVTYRRPCGRCSASTDRCLSSATRGWFCRNMSQAPTFKVHASVYLTTSNYTDILLKILFNTIHGIKL